MIRIPGPDRSVNCAGVSRRSLLRAGVLGAGGLTLADMLRLREAAAAGKSKVKSQKAKEGDGSPDSPIRNPKSEIRNPKSVILIWLDGGPSQHETYDPKPEAPEEVRGPYAAIETSVSGIRISETLPLQAKWAHRMAFIRSVHHSTGDHFAGAHWMLTGRFGATSEDKAIRYPSVGSVAAKMHGPNNPALPPYVGLPAAHSVYIFPGYQGAAYLGTAYNPFQADYENKFLAPDSPKKIVTPAMFRTSAERARLERRATLLERFDLLRRDLDHDGSIASMDHHTQQAMRTLLSSEVREAFDLDAEPAKVAERYGPWPWERYTLLARRLVERGVTFVTVDMPHWDHHDNLKVMLGKSCLHMDRAVGNLVQDLDERGMLDDVLVVVMGEFGRTPKLNQGLEGNPKKNIPGRDHWGQAMSVMMAGGGLRMGQVVGATDAHGAEPAERPYGPEDVLATIYHVLGIDLETEFMDQQGRPIPLLPGGAPIRELV